MRIEIKPVDGERAVKVVAAWRRRLQAALAARWPGFQYSDDESKFTDSTASDNAPVVTSCSGTVRMSDHGDPVAKIRVEWDQKRPGELEVDSCLDARSVSKGAAGTVVALAIFGLLALFVLVGWVYSVFWEWSSIWAHYDRADRRSDRLLTVAWAYLGWLVGPLLCILAGLKLGGWIDDKLDNRLIHRNWARAKRERGPFVNGELRPWLAAEIERIYSAATTDPIRALELGRIVHGAPGTAHPMLPNVVWSDPPGQVRPAPGYTWAIDEKSSFAVKKLEGQPVPGHANVVYGSDGSWSPAPGFMWASDNPASREVKFKLEGQAVPDHPNLVYGRDGKYVPAPGYTWASESTDSLEVKRKESSEAQ